MYRGGKICLTDHFKPLWGRNVPKFGKYTSFSFSFKDLFNLESINICHANIDNSLIIFSNSIVKCF